MKRVLRSLSGAVFVFCACACGTDVRWQSLQAKGPEETTLDERARIGLPSAFVRAISRRATTMASELADARGSLWILVDEHGVVREVRVATSTGKPDLDAVAAEAVEEVMWLPARKEGRPVASWVWMPVSFGNRSGGTSSMPPSVAAAVDSMRRVKR